MENIGGRVRFCHFWDEHYSMVQLTEDRNGKYSTAYVLDTETTPDVRKEAALQAQKELADCMQVWGHSPTSILQRKISRCIYVCTACYNGVGSEKLTASELYRCPNLSYNEDVLRERSIA